MCLVSRRPGERKAVDRNKPSPRLQWKLGRSCQNFRFCTEYDAFGLHRFNMVYSNLRRYNSPPISKVQASRSSFFSKTCAFLTFQERTLQHEPLLCFMLYWAFEIPDLPCQPQSTPTFSKIDVFFTCPKTLNPKCSRNMFDAEPTLLPN